MEKIYSYCIAEKFNFKKIIKVFWENINEKYEDFILLKINNSYIVIFKFWTVISWWEKLKKTFLNKVKKYEINPNDIISETYNYKISNNFLIYKDIINFPKLDKKFIISISYALSQSIKLNYFEEIIEDTINKTSFIPKELANRGKISKKSKEISKLRWEIFLTKSLLNLHYDLLDEPDFFWDYPELAKYYEITSNYLDIKDRIDVLNKKLNILEDIFEMLADEQNHKHETFLEWIIIYLIFIEIIITLVHDILKIV